MKKQGTALWIGLIAVFVIVALALSSAGTAFAMPAAGETVTPTNTAPPETPTETPTTPPTETATPVPTDTPVPTNTPAPGPTQPPQSADTPTSTPTDPTVTVEPTATLMAVLPVTGVSDSLDMMPIAMVAAGLLLFAGGLTLLWRVLGGRSATNQ
ncbi:MAG: hypothetical protein ACYC5O_04600 [Anaerolineae bacterium]